MKAMFLSLVFFLCSATSFAELQRTEETQQLNGKYKVISSGKYCFDNQPVEEMAETLLSGFGESVVVRRAAVSIQGDHFGSLSRDFRDVGSSTAIENLVWGVERFHDASAPNKPWSGVVDERITKSMIAEYQGKVMHFVMAELTSLRVIKQSPLTLEYAISGSYCYFDPSHKFSAIADIYGMNSTMRCIVLERIQE